MRPKSYAERFETPLGPALAVVDDGGRALALSLLRGRAEKREAELARVERALGFELAGEAEGRADALCEQVAEYFAGKRRRFELELAPRGSEFQSTVWRALDEIPFGETRTYGELARALGKPGGSRAVGRANATNPLWVILPCHRVVGSDRRLTGYAGGLDTKRALLIHEGIALEGDRVRAPGTPALFAG